MRARRSIVGATFLALALPGCSGNPPQVVEATGQGSVPVRYDTVSLKLTIDYPSSVKMVALDGARRADAAVVTVLRRAAAEERDVVGGRIELRWWGGERYSGASIIEARLPDPKRAADIVAAVEAAAVRERATFHWFQPFLEVADPADEMAAARTKAVGDARRRAVALAGAQQLRLGEPLSIVEASASPPPRIELKVWKPDQGKIPDVKSFIERAQSKEVLLVTVRVRFEARR